MTPIAYFASDFEANVSLQDVIGTVVQGAFEWNGRVAGAMTEDGLLAFEFRAFVAGEDVMLESVLPCVLGRDGNVRLVTVVLEAPLRDPALAEQLHRGVNEALNLHPSEPLTDDAARAALEARWSELVPFEFVDPSAPAR